MLSVLLALFPFPAFDFNFPLEDMFPPPPPPPVEGVTWGCGTASWYGTGFHGNLTANGETYNQWSMTAAHKTLPFGTKVVVNYGEREVQVRINDRGPYVGDRVIDLSRAAMEALGGVSVGTPHVCLSVL
jgi:rare lipoprotein A